MNKEASQLVPTGQRANFAWRRAGFLLLAVILVTALAGCVASVGAEGASAPRTTITAEQLEQQYGLRVNVLALTAAGGIVDLRLKVLDAAKAAGLLGKQAPTLQVAGATAALTAPEDGLPQDLTPVDGRMLLVLYPNRGNVVRQGTSVSVTFGDMQLEPILVK